MDIDLILLAAGNSRRFGSNKLLYEVDGKPMYAHMPGEAALHRRAGKPGGKTIPGRGGKPVWGASSGRQREGNRVSGAASFGR